MLIENLKVKLNIVLLDNVAMLGLFPVPLLKWPAFPQSFIRDAGFAVLFMVYS